MLSRRILQDRPSLQDNANPRFMHLLVFKIIEKKLLIAEISHTFIFIAMSTIACIKPTYHLCM